MGVETESEMSGLVEVVVFIVSATKIRREVVKELVVFIQLGVSEVVVVVGRVKKNSKGAE